VPWHDDSPRCSTVNPDDPDGPPIDVIIPLRVVRAYFKRNPVAYENLRCAKWVLEHPLRIFSGVREFQEGGWCYTGRPLYWHIRPEVVAEFPVGLVYVVYIQPSRLVYEWRAEDVDPEDVLAPLGFQDRYGGLTWKSTS